VDDDLKRIQKHQPLIQDLYRSAKEKLAFEPDVSIVVMKNRKNSHDPLGKTAFYDPANHKIGLYVQGRHIKDILRSLSHELIHHAQNCRGEFKNGAATVDGYAQEDGHLREMEREAYEQGNLNFRDWEDNLKSKGGKSLFTSTKYKSGPYMGSYQGEKFMNEARKPSARLLKTLRGWPKGWRGGESPGKHYGNFRRSDWTAKDKGYIEEKGNGFYVLTDLGREVLAANRPEETQMENNEVKLREAIRELVEKFLNMEHFRGSPEEEEMKSKMPNKEFADYVTKGQFSTPDLKGEMEEIPGMEGPFQFSSGAVLYYDPKVGKYYDRGKDMYLDREESSQITMNEEKQMESKQMRIKETELRKVICGMLKEELKANKEPLEETEDAEEVVEAKDADEEVVEEGGGGSAPPWVKARSGKKTGKDLDKDAETRKTDFLSKKKEEKDKEEDEPSSKNESKETWMPQGRTVNEKKKIELNSTLMKRWGYAKKENNHGKSR